MGNATQKCNNKQPGQPAGSNNQTATSNNYNKSNRVCYKGATSCSQSLVHPFCISLCAVSHFLAWSGLAWSGRDWGRPLQPSGFHWFGRPFYLRCCCGCWSATFVAVSAGISPSPLHTLPRIECLNLCSNSSGSNGSKKSEY